MSIASQSYGGPSSSLSGLNMAHSVYSDFPPEPEATTLLKDISEQTHVSVGDKDFWNPHVPETQASRGSPPPLGDKRMKKKQKPQPREIVDENHLVKLIAAYNVHFEQYSKGRTNVTQLILALVWKAAYGSYKEDHPASTFKQASLKERLREALKEIATGNSNELTAEKVAPQCNIVMARLRCTDGAAKRNVLRKRQSIAAGQPMLLDSDSEEGESDPPITTPPANNPLDASQVRSNTTPASPQHLKKGQREVMKENLPPLTKGQMLQRQLASIKKLCSVYKQSTAKREALVEFKIQGSCEKQKRHRLANLKNARDYGVITDEEFKATLTVKNTLWEVCQDDILQQAWERFLVPCRGGHKPPNFTEVDKFLQEWKDALGELAE